jgi:hypothetical protein
MRASARPSPFLKRLHKAGNDLRSQRLEREPQQPQFQRYARGDA